MTARLKLVARWLFVRLMAAVVGGVVFFVPISAILRSFDKPPRAAIVDWFYSQSPFYDLSNSRVFLAAMACGCLIPNIRFSRTTSIMLLMPLLGALVGMFSFAIIETSAASQAVARVYDPIEKQFAEHPHWKGLLDAYWLARPLPDQKFYPSLYITNFIWCWTIGGGMLVGIPLGISILSTQRRRAIFVGITIVGAVAGEMLLWNAVVSKFSEWERYRTEAIHRCLS